MRVFLLVAVVSISLFAEWTKDYNLDRVYKTKSKKWDNVYAFEDVMVDKNIPNLKSKFKKSFDSGEIFDESSKNILFKKTKKRVASKKAKYFYSTNERDYYKVSISKYHKFPTTNY